MCLLITANAGVGEDIEDHWLEDFYKRNDDGYGFMYAADDKLHIIKRLGSVEDFKKDWRSLTGATRAVHLRMRTHGDIDLENCHPYEVIPGEIALMHNGILRTGNAADKTKSDTWHFIQDYLRPILERDPGMMFEPAFQEMLGEFIGHSNKFVLLDRFGGMVEINYAHGYTWRDMWMSNLYAWSAPYERKDSKPIVTFDDWQYDKDYQRFRESLADDDKHDTELTDEELDARELAESIEDAIDYLDRSFYKRASFLSKDNYVTFAVQRGEAALWGAVEDLVDGELSEEQFCRLIKDGTLYAGDGAAAYDM